jgi:uncharacterized repeat protein (TIGR01451 family)
MSTTSNSGAIETTGEDTLMASIDGCGQGSTSTSILVDPMGVVFDSATGLPMAGARVTLIDVTGAGNGGVPNGQAVVFDLDGTTPYPSSVVSDAEGRYRFPMVAPSLYKLQVVAPTNYTFPSKIEPGNLAGGRVIQLYGSYGGAFTVSAETGDVTLDLPLDPVPGLLYLEKSASRSTVEIADFVDYTIRVHNSAEVQLDGVAVDDSLPAGFRYEPGSLRLDGATGRPTPAPAPAANCTSMSAACRPAASPCCATACASAPAPCRAMASTAPSAAASRRSAWSAASPPPRSR